jgi:hypothetical protein
MSLKKSPSTTSQIQTALEEIKERHQKKKLRKFLS